MGCCQTKPSPYLTAARCIQTAYADIDEIQPQLYLKGSYGYPFLAMLNNERVFIKVVGVRPYTRRVLKKLQDVSSEQIITPISFRYVKDQAVVVYPWIRGGDLIENCTNFISKRRRVRLIRSLLKAVNELHSYGIAHRDIKLENVLVQRDVCYLIDLDTCDDASMLYSMGTSSYLPPKAVVRELFRHEHISNADKSYCLDAYAFGKTIAKILLVGTVDCQERRLWNFWVDRDRASPTAVRVLLEMRKYEPMWDLVYWWCVENIDALQQETPYLKLTDEAIEKYPCGILGSSAL